MEYKSPFHQGEIEVQRLAGEEHIATKVGQIIQTSVPSGALNFLRKQSILWLGVDDNEKQLWAFPIFGSPDFINPHNGNLLEIDLSKTPTMPKNWQCYLQKGKAIGCLAIEFSSRRRLRINGIIIGSTKEQLRIKVQQSYPNCPKYIRKREMLGTPDIEKFKIGKSDMAKYEFLSTGTQLTDQVKNIISYSDTAFIASLGSNGADLSHRGGAAGFMKCTDTSKIIIPDYKGNSMFNTLGNLKQNPNAGLLVIDFDQGYFLQLSGKVELFFHNIISRITTGGTDRYWKITIQNWELYQMSSSIKWEHLDHSPYNPE